MKAKALCNMSWRLHSLGQAQEAYETAMQSLQLDDKLDATWINLSVIHGARLRQAGVQAGA
jgi:hypothetical protein